MNRYRIFTASVIALLAVACVPVAEDEFDVVVETEDGILSFAPEGGMQTIEVKATGEWVATSEQPWISVSPANGRGSAVCQVRIDSTLSFNQRDGFVSITGDEEQRVPVRQDGFEYQILVDKPEMNVEQFAEYGSRFFEVSVMANVDFDVVIPDTSKYWIDYKKSKLELDRGARPRKSVVRFDWKVNNRDWERIVKVAFKPKEPVQMGRLDEVKVIQKAAQTIPKGTVEGDSLAILAVSRTLGAFVPWDTSEKLEHWNNVKVWKDGPDKGRVRYVQFFMFKTEESIPYEIQYLDAAEEIVIYSNANHFLRSLDTGEYISKLTQLKRLTIGAYGLTSLHESFTALKNLEYLDLNSNCFQKIPEILNETNFPNLHALILNANKRYSIYDLSNDVRENKGGFIEEPKFPERLLKWNRLDTLVLSVNLLQGSLPKMENHEKYTLEDVETLMDDPQKDTLPLGLVGVPKVLPNTSLFAINHNRLTGELPEWLMKHPKLDLWAPFSLIFSQEGKNSDGVNAGFENEPTSLDDYYIFYPNKKYNPNRK